MAGDVDCPEGISHGRRRPVWWLWRVGTRPRGPEPSGDERLIRAVRRDYHRRFRARATPPSVRCTRRSLVLDPYRFRAAPASERSALSRAVDASVSADGHVSGFSSQNPFPGIAPTGWSEQCGGANGADADHRAPDSADAAAWRFPYAALVHGARRATPPLTSARVSRCTRCSQLGYTWLTLDVSIAADAPIGPRNLIVTNAGPVGWSTGFCGGCVTVT